jgi:hypothetical protein
MNFYDIFSAVKIKILFGLRSGFLFSRNSYVCQYGYLHLILTRNKFTVHRAKDRNVRNWRIHEYMCRRCILYMMALNRLAHKSAKTGYTVIVHNWRIFSTSTGVLHMYNEYTNITMCPPQNTYSKTPRSGLNRYNGLLIFLLTIFTLCSITWSTQKSRRW